MHPVKAGSKEPDDSTTRHLTVYVSTVPKPALKVKKADHLASLELVPSHLKFLVFIKYAPPSRGKI